MVDLAQLSWNEQVQLMENTDILVGVHGAGLTQALFLPPNSYIIELAATSFQNRVHFRQLSAWLGHDYQNILCKFVYPNDQVVISPSILVKAVQSTADHYHTTQFPSSLSQ